MHSEADIMERIRELHRQFGRKRMEPGRVRALLRRFVLATKVVCSWVRLG